MSEQPVDGAGLLPAEHARALIAKLGLDSRGGASLAAELRNALVPALTEVDGADIGRDSVINLDRVRGGIERVLRLATEATKIATPPPSSGGGNLFLQLAERLGIVPERMTDALRFARALAGLTAPNPEAKGLPCPHCGATLEQLRCDRSVGAVPGIIVRVNMIIDTKRNLRGLFDLLKSLGSDLPEGAKKGVRS